VTTITLHAGDCRDSLRRLIAEGVRVHSVVTDPPYGLVSVQKRFGKPDSAPARTERNDGSFARLSGGFMGKQWDATGIERDPEFWRLIHDVLLPGGFVFAFSGSRTGHWQAVAMEQAGLIMHPMHGWVYGSGFPKAHNAARAVDKALGVEGSLGGVKPGHGGFVGRGSLSAVQSLKGTLGGEGGFARPWMDDPESVDRYRHTYVPGSPEAEQWEGWAYGTQTQKPALEPIFLGQRPMSEKTGAANLLKHGVGAFNIDGCRVGYTSEADQASAKPQGAATSKVGALAGKTQHNGDRSEFTADNTKGRHPANLILDGSPEVAAMFPDTRAGVAVRRKSGGKNIFSEKDKPPMSDMGYDDSGSAARFFHQFPPDTDPLIYHPKAGKADRAGGRHPTVKPVALLRYLIRHITPPGGVVLDPFAGSGTTAEAARQEGIDCILMEAEPEYVAFLRERFDLLGDGLGDIDALLYDDSAEDLI